MTNNDQLNEMSRRVLETVARDIGPHDPTILMYGMMGACGVVLTNIWAVSCPWLTEQQIQDEMNSLLQRMADEIARSSHKLGVPGRIAYGGDEAGTSRRRMES